MSKLYETLEKAKIGIFESPTGTGKSLSLICGAITWLKNFENKKKSELKKLLDTAEKSINTSASKSGGGVYEQNREQIPDWFLEHSKKKEENEKIKQARKELNILETQENRVINMRRKVKRKRDNTEDDPVFDELFKNAKHIKEAVKQELKEKENGDISEVDDDDDLITEYISDDDDDSRSGKNEYIEEEESEKTKMLKIFYCSRTHSQLSQFVKEIQRSSYSSVTCVVSLGSRQNLCINETVQKLNNLTLINEKCLDLQKNKRDGKILKELKENKQAHKRSGCPYYRNNTIEDMRDHLLVDIKDIEQSIELGRKLKSCPYYSSRYAVSDAEVVVLPYQVLLHKSTREACGIELKGNIVIIDEAHNLLETINNIHSVILSGMHLSHAYAQLNHYLQRYYSRLNPKNLMYVKQVLFIMNAFIKQIGGTLGKLSEEKKYKGDPDVKVYHTNDFLSIAGVDNINLFKLLSFCNKSQIAQKLHGFSGKYQVQVKEKQSEVKKNMSSLSDFLSKLSGKPQISQETSNQEEILISSPLFQVQGFLQALTNPNKDGRVICIKQNTIQKSSLKFLLLNPAVQFRDIVQESRSVILAGGTMEPVSEVVNQLFLPCGVSPERVTHFSCGHVIPPENLLSIALSHGPSGKQLDFTYQSRELPFVMEELGRVLVNICTIIPGGLVCFFPSYEYEQRLYNYWEKNGTIAKLNIKKTVFREPKQACQVDKILQSYTKCISQSNSNPSFYTLSGAILFSVVGGKMSEGINFSDDLGRCVVMIGLPYPNIKSPELQEKINYLNKFASTCDGKPAGEVHYENICMKAVNQSIGRAIRHKNDFATILLLDARYNRVSVKSALPKWISNDLQTFHKFGTAFQSIRQFFLRKKK
ncbi:ATP-dependent DNA helicase DDX11-like [Limulus polyphemus]|uniref:ATP-dependent DNA helicase DDX11-like n=1 Tax=Limulus polyphemus TaxID=6850 RepID=A0ABM1BSW4_LIMPO|nr:ATP-dependent DNA helicase DDX11-like [Limulus polyphemus]